MQLSEIITRVIVLARQIQAEFERSLRVQRESKLRDFLSHLPAATIYMLTTVMYLGRGDFGTAGLLNSYENMSDTFDKPEFAIDQMLEKVPLPEYLEDGLKRLSEGGVDVNTLLSSYSDTPLASLDDGAAIELSIGPWYCDTCGEIIDGAENGMLQWLTHSDADRRVGRDLRIVHHFPASPRGGTNGCYPDEHHELKVDRSTLSDHHLESVLGPDGLVILLSLIEDGELPAREVNRVIMRLFVPGYERARRYFQKAVSTGVVDVNLPEDYFFQYQLRDIIANIPRLEGRP